MPEHHSPNCAADQCKHLEAETIAEELSAGAESDLDQELAKARNALDDETP